MSEAEVFVSFSQDDEGWPPVDHEHLEAEKIGASRYRLLRAPAFAPAMAVGDILATNEVDGRQWVTHVAEESDRWLARVIAFHKKIDDSAVVRTFESMGCNVTVTKYRIITLDIPPTIEPEPILDKLEEGVNQGLWECETPVLPESLR